MSRIKLARGLQAAFLNRVSKALHSDWNEVAQLASVDKRTFFDWRREKYTMTYEALIKLSKISNVHLPPGIRILPQYWSVKKAGLAGALKRYELYGNPGTPEGRVQGGRTSQIRFSLDPDHAKQAGFKVRKSISCPAESELLAEFIGIMLGDGGMSKQQAIVSLNGKTEAAYGTFVKKIMFDLFGILPTINYRKDSELYITATGRNLVEFLLGKGLKIGNKINQQVGVPDWILRNKEYVKACLRGLIDTDGGVYFHTHVTKGIKYRHLGLCFTSYSKLLLAFVHNELLNLGLGPRIYEKGRVYIYDRNYIKKYFDMVGSHNSHHIERFISYKHSKDYN
jgi:hypothetical protein